MKKGYYSHALQRSYNAATTHQISTFFEEVEVGGGRHTLHVSASRREHDWSEPYQKSGSASYRNRIVRVPYPPNEESQS